MLNSEQHDISNKEEEMPAKGKKKGKKTATKRKRSGVKKVKPKFPKRKTRKHKKR